MNQRIKATSVDVAVAAGVSQSTVSRALGGVGGISEETRARVVAAARALNYTLDHRAARFRTGATNTIAVVILTMPGQHAADINPFYLELLGAIGGAAAEKGYDLLLSFQGAEETLRAGFETSGRADGTIVVGSARNSAGWAFFAEAHAAGERIVCWGAPDDALPTVRCDNRAAAAAAVAHLVERGRSRIAFLGPGWEHQRSYAERREGYVAALAERGLLPIEADEPGGGDRESQGHAATLALLDEARAPDAIFAASDLLAFGAMRALRERGLLVPDDVALVGFDGIAATTQVTPPLTTIAQDCRAAGTALVEAMLDAIAGHEPAFATVPMRLVARESS